MFQNILEREKVKTKEETINKKDILANIFSKKYITLYLITFMVSTITMGQAVSPFSIAIITASIANEIPIIAILIIALIGNIVGSGTETIVNFIATMLIFFASFLVVEPKYNDENRNEKIKLSKKIFVSTIIVQFAKIIFTSFMLYDIFVSITFSIITVVFYKIFVNSITVITEYNKIKAFSIEEVIGGSLLIAIAVCSLGDLNIIGFSIRNIISIFIVLVLGWKNGILIGTTSGVSIGITLGIIAQNDPVIIGAYAISGMIAGVLNKLGKIGVIAGFIVGDVILTIVSNGGVQNLIIFKEILIAGLGLLAVPQNINLNIKNIIGDKQFLPTNITKTLDRSKETMNKLEEMSNTVNHIANSYEDENNIHTDKEEVKKSNQQIFITEFQNNIENIKENILYDVLSNNNSVIMQELFETLQNKQKINENDLLKVCANNNHYILGFKENENITNQDILKMVQAINDSYKISKMNFIFDNKIKIERKRTSNQLKDVSKAISEMAKDMKVEINNEKQYEIEKEKIVVLLKQKEIIVQCISITKKKDDRFIIEIYIEESDITNEEEILKKIITKVLNEKIIINKRECIEEEKCIKYILISDDKYEMSIGISSAIKDNNSVSGDSILNIRLKDGKYLLAISDGMGNGAEARKSSQIVVKLLARLLNSGFNREVSVDLINNNLLNVREEVFATIDLAIIDLYKGNIEFIKNGACPTYIKNKKRIQIIKSLTLPAGIIGDIKKDIFDIDINGGEHILMCSDGILDSNIEYKNKELWIKYLLEDIEENNPPKIAEIILNEAIDNNVGKIKDDMSVIVCNFNKKL